MISTYVKLITPIIQTHPIHARRNILVRSNKDDDDVWDPSEQRRIDENKQWRRDHPPEDAWDIDKERDAKMYKIESLESLLKLEYKKDDKKKDKSN